MAINLNVNGKPVPLDDVISTGSSMSSALALLEQAGIAGFHKRLPCAAPEIRRTMILRSPLAHPSVMFHRRVFEAGFRYDVLAADAWARAEASALIT